MIEACKPADVHNQHGDGIVAHAQDGPVATLDQPREKYRRDEQTQQRPKRGERSGDIKRGLSREADVESRHSPR